MASNGRVDAAARIKSTLRRTKLVAKHAPAVRVQRVVGLRLASNFLPTKIGFDNFAIPLCKVNVSSIGANSIKEHLVSLSVNQRRGFSLLWIFLDVAGWDLSVS